MSTQLIVRSPATYEDLIGLPETCVGELIDGVLYGSPRPASPHAFAAMTFAGELYSAFQRGLDGPGGWWILLEPELMLARDILVPNIAGWRRERMPRVPDVSQFTIAPDRVCEVISPPTARLDLATKLPKYAVAQVPSAWLVDPLNRSVEVFRSTDIKPWVLVSAFGGEDRMRAEPFEAVEIDLKAVWIDSAAR